MKKIITAMLLALLVSADSFAKIIASCPNGSWGQTYYPEGDFGPEGWVEDKIRDGNITISFNPKTREYSVVTVDASGIATSVIDHWSVSEVHELSPWVPASNGSFAVSVEYVSGALVAYSYDAKAKTLTWVQLKYGASIMHKGSVLVSKNCN
jgi:hypothetical protein